MDAICGVRMLWRVTQSPTRPGGRAPAWLLLGPAIAASLGSYLLTVPIGPAGVAMQRDMQLPAAGIVWALAAYLLPAAAAGTAGFLLGRRWPVAMALPAIALMATGSLLTTLAGGSGSLLLGRAVTGFGAGLAWGVTAALVLAQPAARRSWLAQGVAGVAVLAMVVGPVTGMILARAVGWRLPFTLALPLAAVAFLATAVGGIAVLAGRGTRPVA